VDGCFERVVRVGVKIVWVLHEDVRSGQIQIIGYLIDARGAVDVVHHMNFTVWMVRLNIRAAQRELEAANAQTRRQIVAAIGFWG